MSTELQTQLLDSKGLKKTPIRRELLALFLQQSNALSFHDIQDGMPAKLDKSTLYRNLTSFEEVGLIHKINDHSGIAKFALGQQDLSDDHAHFVCDNCETVSCMEGSVSIDVKVGDKVHVKQIQTIVHGICGNCNS